MSDTYEAVRHGRHEMEQEEGPADMADGDVVHVGDCLEFSDGSNLPDDVLLDLDAVQQGSPLAPHSSDGGSGQAIFAIGNGNDTLVGGSYAPGENVYAMLPSGGGLVGRLASGESVTKGGPLVSAGDGTLRAYGQGTDTTSGDSADAIKAYAEETMDASNADVGTDPMTADDSVFIDIEF